VAGGNRLLGIGMEPALPARGQRTAVPGKGESPATGAGKGDQILLQGIDAEGVDDLVIVQRPVRPVGPHEELAVLAVEARGDAKVSQRGIVEIAKHRLLGRFLHRLVVVRASPCCGFSLVTPSTYAAADEPGRKACLGHYRCRCPQCKHHAKQCCRMQIHKTTGQWPRRWHLEITWFADSIVTALLNKKITVRGSSSFHLLFCSD